VLLCVIRVTTNLENLEYSGISTNVERGNSVQSFGIILTNKIVSVRSNICLTQRGLGVLNEQSLVNFGDGHSALVTCYIVGVDVERLLTYEGHYYMKFLAITYAKVVYGSEKSRENSAELFSPTLWSP